MGGALGLGEILLPDGAQPIPRTGDHWWVKFPECLNLAALEIMALTERTVTLGDSSPMVTMMSDEDDEEDGGARACMIKHPLGTFRHGDIELVELIERTPDVEPLDVGGELV